MDMVQNVLLAILPLYIRGSKKKQGGLNLFRDKTINLKNQTLRVVTFAHIPATDKVSEDEEKGSKAYLTTGSSQYKGTEVEIVDTLSRVMFFVPFLYEPANATNTRWGSRINNSEDFNGLLGEMTQHKADFALGDLHNSPLHLDLMDLTVPYNTECLTFLTPVSLVDNSWMTLVMPFQLYMWLCVLAALFTLGLIFHALAKFYYNFYETYAATHRPISLMNSNCSSMVKIHTSYSDLRLRNEYHAHRTKGLYIFGEIINSVMYSYGMLLLISLPRFPSGWSLRMLTGWYSLYCSLVTVSYRASLTAILARPTPRITIDTLEQLDYSGIACGGWDVSTKEFFMTLTEKTAMKIAEKFELVNDSDSGIDRVAKGTFAYYENTFFLKAMAVKRQTDFVNDNKTTRGKNRQLHVMENCIINMPISIGLQKNSPLKPTVDKLIRRIIEAGFIKKWQDDIMQKTLNKENFEESRQEIKALMNLQKLYGAFVALFIGYFLSIVVIVYEMIVWQFTVVKHPFYNKYNRQITYPKGYSVYTEETKKNKIKWEEKKAKFRDFFRIFGIKMHK